MQAMQKNCQWCICYDCPLIEVDKSEKETLNGTNDWNDNEQKKQWKRQSKNAKIVKRLCN